MVVTPPAAAALVAVQYPSHSVRPGSFTCTWESTKPGMITRFPTSRTYHKIKCHIMWNRACRYEKGFKCNVLLLFLTNYSVTEHFFNSNLKEISLAGEGYPSFLVSKKQTPLHKINISFQKIKQISSSSNPSNLSFWPRFSWIPQLLYWNPLK